jgi:hypothetical protein
LRRIVTVEVDVRGSVFRCDAEIGREMQRCCLTAGGIGPGSRTARCGYCALDEAVARTGTGAGPAFLGAVIGDGWDLRDETTIMQAANRGEVDAAKVRIDTACGLSRGSRK